MFNRIILSVASRLPATSSVKRDLINTAFDHLQDVAYTRLLEAGFDPAHIIDVGACSGDWSRSARHIFTKAPIIMIEARTEEDANLTATAREIGNATYKIALLGSETAGAASFSINAVGSSIFPELSNVPQTKVTLPMTTLDTVVDAKAPAFLKIDCQGAQLEILKGGSKTLEACEVVQLEVALLQYNEGAPLAAEVIAFMDQRGFAIFDFASFIRPLDKHLLQTDIIFTRKTSSLRPYRFDY
jgi:FkbM family methyltransferase